MKILLIFSSKTVDRFARYGRNVWKIQDEDKWTCAQLGIVKTRNFFESLGLPKKLSDVGIDSKLFSQMAKEAIRTSNLSKSSYVLLNEEDVINIYNACL